MNMKILKGLLAGSLLASSAFAGVYIGFDYGNDNSSLNDNFVVMNKSTSTVVLSSDTTSTYNFNYSSIKLGYETDGNWKYQVKASQINFGGKTLNEIGFDILKEFEMTRDFFPYVKIGAGYGWRKAATDWDPSPLHESSLEAGLGISYKMLQHISLNLGVDYVYRNWDDAYSNGSVYYKTERIDENILRSYIGIEYLF